MLIQLGDGVVSLFEVCLADLCFLVAIFDTEMLKSGRE